MATKKLEHYGQRNQYRFKKSLKRNERWMAEKEKDQEGMNDNRLSCMEEKLDKPSEAVISMARIEDRMIIAFKRLG